MPKHTVHDIKVIKYDDWETIYLDGEMFYDGHRAWADDWLELFDKIGCNTDIEYREEED